MALPAGAETLLDALRAAYSNNPTLRAERAALRAADEGVPQALSDFRPTTQAAGSLARRTQDTSTGGRTNLTPNTLSLTVSQSVYRGGRTVAATRQAENLVLSGRARLASVEQAVLGDAVAVYINVLRDQAVLQLDRNNELVLRRQLEATQDRFRVGEITRTDVAQAEARLARAASDRIQSEGNLISSRAAYKAVIGTPPGALEPAPQLFDVPASEEEAIRIAVDNNPDLLAAVFAEAASRNAIDVADGGLLPTVSVDGDLSRVENSIAANTETESASVTARVVIPLYQAGAVYSRARERRQTNQQRRIEVEEARRDVIEGVTTAWERLSTARARYEARLEEVRAAEIALEGVRQEAEVGSRTTLDVLDAQQELLDARVGLVVDERDEYVAAFDLRAAIGQLTADQIGLDVERYDPALHYKRVRGAWWGRNIGGE